MLLILSLLRAVILLLYKKLKRARKNLCTAAAQVMITELPQCQIL